MAQRYKAPGDRAPGSADGLLTRREILRRGVLGAAGLAACPAALAALPAVLAACNRNTPASASSPLVTPNPTPPPPSPTPGLTGRLRVGFNNPLTTEAELQDLWAGLSDVDAAFTAKTGLALSMNEFISVPYLSSEPDDVCMSTSTYRPGYVLQLISAAGLLAPLDDVWAAAKDNFNAAVADAVTASDGHVYGIPFDSSPWVFFYRKSLWASKGYEVPTTWTELLALCTRMKSDGLTPIAFGDRDGWVALGTFDMLNLRLNGYDFHIGLLTGKEKWTDHRVIAAFEAWRELIPYCTKVSLNLTWQDAVGTLVGNRAGMFYFDQSLTGKPPPAAAPTESSGLDPIVVDDLDFFEFPYFGNQWDAERVLEAPINIWVMPSKSPTLQADLTNAEAYLDFWAKGSTQLLMSGRKPGYIPTARDTDTSQLDRLSKKAFELVGGANHLTQFFDRDTRPDFPSLTGGYGGYVRNFLNNPSQDLTVFTQSIQRFWDALPPFSSDSVR